MTQKSTPGQKKIYVKGHINKIWNRLSETQRYDINKKTRNYFEKLVTKSGDKAKAQVEK